MRHLRRHTWLMGVLSALLMGGLLQLNPAEHNLSRAFRNSGLQDAGMSIPAPEQEHGSAHGMAIPLSATPPAAQHKPLFEGDLAEVKAYGGERTDGYRVAALTPSPPADRNAGDGTSVARSHLFCVYRL